MPAAFAVRHIVIVGAGHAGGCAAEALRAAGHRGPISLIGKESHPPYERPPLSKELLVDAIPVEKTYLREHSYYEKADIILRLGRRVAGIHRAAQRIELDDGETIPYDALLLTTGARPRRLSVPGENSPRVLYLRDIDDALVLRQWLVPNVRLAVIGGGFVGLEVAASARKRGVTVTVLESAQQLLGRVAPREIGEYFALLHRRNGVDLRTGITVVGFEDDGRELRILTRNDDFITADVAVVGIGAIPNTELAAEAGLATADGLIVDERGMTSDAAIFAAGDVTRHFNPLLGRSIRLESWENAQNQAIAVAKAMTGSAEAFAEIPWLWSNQYDVNLQMAGAPERWTDMVWRGAPTDSSFTVFSLAGPPVAAITINNSRDMRFARRLIARSQKVDATALADRTIKLESFCR